MKKTSSPAQKPAKSRVARHFTRTNLIYLAMAISLCVYWFFLMIPQLEAPRNYDGNTSNQYMFLHLSRYAVHDAELEKQFPAWQPRVASQALAGWLVNALCPTDKGITIWNGYTFGNLGVAFGVYQAGWLALTLLIIWIYRRDAVLVMLLAYAGLTYNLAIPSGCWFFPWDMPSMCLFTWAYLSWEAGQARVFLVAAFLACVFKETGAVLCLLPLFARRWISPLVLAAAGYAARAWFMRIYQIHTIALPWNNATGVSDFFVKSWSQIAGNVVELFSFHLNSFFFVGCGMLAGLFLLRAKWQTKVVVAAFMAGQFCFGNAHEFREWHELLPLSACVVSDNLALAREGAREIPAPVKLAKA